MERAHSCFEFDSKFALNQAPVSHGTLNLLKPKAIEICTKEHSICFCNLGLAGFVVVLIAVISLCIFAQLVSVEEETVFLNSGPRTQIPCPESGCCQVRKRKKARVGHGSPEQKRRRPGSWLLSLPTWEGVALQQQITIRESFIQVSQGHGVEAVFKKLMPDVSGGSCQSFVCLSSHYIHLRKTRNQNKTKGSYSSAYCLFYTYITVSFVIFRILFLTGSCCVLQASLEPVTTSCLSLGFTAVCHHIQTLPN